MATINEINQFQSIRGDVSAGGGSSGVINIDTKPLDLLGQYTFLFNREQWKQNEIEGQRKAKEMADIAAYDLNAIPEESKVLRQKYNELYDYVRNNPTVLDYKNNELGWLEYNKKKNDFENILSSAKQRNVVYAKRQSDIAANTSVAEKQRLERELMNDVKRTNINVPLPFTQEYDVKPVDVKAVPSVKFDVSIKDGNFVDTRKFTIPDMAAVNAQASAIELDLLKDAATPTTAQEQSQYDARVSSKRLEPVETSKEINKAIALLPKDENGVTDFSKAPTVLLKAIEQAKNYNDYVNGMREDLKTGKYKDKLGTITFAQNRGLDEADFQPINFNDGISPGELIKMRILSVSPAPSYETKIDQTNEAFNQQQLGLQWERLGLDKARLAKSDNQDLLAADGVLREITDIINKGDMTANQVDVVDSNTGRTKRVFKIGDPNILQKFGNIDKDGTTTNVPDEARYNPATNEIDLVYFQRDDEGVIKPTKTGGSYIKESKTLNSRTWANLVSQRTFSGQDRGAVNEIIQSVITKNGGDLYKIAKALNGGTIAPETTTTTSSSSSSSSSSGYTREQLKASGKGWTDERIDQAVKAGKIKLKN